MVEAERNGVSIKQNKFRNNKPSLYSVRDLEMRFKLEEEYMREEKALKTRTFFHELKQCIAASKASWP